MKINPHKVASYLTLASALIGFSEQVRRLYGQYSVYSDKRRKQKEGFGFTTTTYSLNKKLERRG